MPSSTCKVNANIEIQERTRQEVDLKTFIIFKSLKSRNMRRILNPDRFMALRASADVTQNIHERGGRMGRMGDRRKDGEGGEQEGRRRV